MYRVTIEVYVGRRRGAAGSLASLRSPSPSRVRVMSTECALDYMIVCKIDKRTTK